jgi:hypothetical protein
VVLFLAWGLAASCAQSDTAPETEGAALADPDPAGAERSVASGEPPSPTEEHLPRWRVFFAGKPYVWSKVPGRPGAIPVFKKGYWKEPSVVDGVCPLILVPQTSEGVDRGTGEWIKLSASLLRNHGLGYFAGVIEKYSLDVGDLRVIRSLLKDLDAIPVEAASVLGDASFHDYEGETQPGSLGGAGPDDHTVGPWGAGGGRARSSPPEWPVRAHQSPHHPGVPHPQPPRDPRWPSRPGRRSPNGDAGGYSSRDMLNGLNPQDQPEGNYPGWDDPKRDPSTREVFRCDGRVYFGYRNMCPDYNLLPNERWGFALDRFSVRLLADVRDDPRWKMSPWILHNFWNDGKNPGCMTNARQVGEVACGAVYGAPFAACALVPGCWALFVAAASTPVGVVGAIEVGLGINECLASVQDYATQHICTR